MDASLETLVIAASVFASAPSSPRCGPQGKASDQELIALAVAQAVSGLASDRQFLGTIGRLLPGCLPDLPGQSQYNRRLRRLTPQITRVQLGVAELVARGRVRLQLLSDRHGTPLGCDLRPAGENEREGVFQLACAHPGSLLFADAGHRGREHHESLHLVGVELIVPDKHRLGERPPAEVTKARTRLVIESVFATLKRQMRMEDHLTRTLPELAQRIAQRLLALTIGMFLTTLLGRPPCALAAYDGR
ncbi:MAG: transposase [Actinobacteria bacterium]|nr:transposase [Actinomycetota bacterium]